MKSNKVEEVVTNNIRKIYENEAPQAEKIKQTVEYIRLLNNLIIEYYENEKRERAKAMQSKDKGKPLPFASASQAKVNKLVKN